MQLQLSLIQAVSYVHYNTFFASYTNITGITVRFTQSHFTGVEATGFVMVHLELTKGWSVYPFSVNVTASEKSPVFAEGNGIIILYICY